MSGCGDGGTQHCVSVPVAFRWVISLRCAKANCEGYRDDTAACRSSPPRRSGLNGPVKTRPPVQPSSSSARHNGTVLYAEDPDAQWFPASLTKLMTAYVTFQALKAGTVSPSTKVVCSQKATAQAPTNSDSQSAARSPSTSR